MKVRTIKRNHLQAMYVNLAIEVFSKAHRLAKKLATDAANDFRAMTYQVDAPKETFTVARKKDGEVVGTFDTLVKAEAVIGRAKQQKKAALHLV